MSTNGIYGLSGSGIDVDSMVKKLMDARKLSYAGLYQQKQRLEWQKTDYNTLYTDIKSYKDSVFNYKLEGTLNPRMVSTTNDAVVTATANADAVNVTHSVTVSQLADGVKMVSSGEITPSSGEPPTKASKDTLTSQLYGGTAPSGTITLKIANGTASKEITVDPSQSIYELVSQINSAGVNVQATYDTNVDRLFLYSTNTGSAAEISFEGSNDAGLDLLDKLNLIDSSNEATFSKTGQDAQVTVDGVSFTQSSNTFTMANVTYTLKGVSPTTTTTDESGATTQVAQATNLSVSLDTDQVVQSVKDFVDSYNKILAEVNGKLDEPYYRDYPPLTDDQKADMKDDEITAWTEKAKSGLLSSDATLQNLVYEMRNDLATPVSGLTGKYTTAASIGITTGDYTEGGKLYLDEDKLRQALTDDPDIMNKLFSTSGATDSTSGIANRLYATMDKGMDQLYDKAGTTESTSYDTKSALAIEIQDYTDRISRAEDMLDNLQDRYYKQFDAMETALSQLNSQSSWLSQQLGTSS